MFPMNRYVQVITTVGNKEEAERISKELVEKRLAGCVQTIGPIDSVYWWNGEMETAEEWLCLIKSKKSLYDQIEKTVENVHPYEAPEIICTLISEGSENYLEWLDKELKKINRNVHEELGLWFLEPLLIYRPVSLRIRG